MNRKERAAIAVLQTHIEYIRKSIDEIKGNLKDMSHHLEENSIKIASVQKGLENHLKTHQRDLTKLAILVSAIAAIISLAVKLA